jgi:hypothetical protein
MALWIPNCWRPFRSGAVHSVFLAFLNIATVSFGHGNPVHVDVSGNGLIVSGGFPMTQGFANQSWDSHEDAALDTASNNRLTSTYPGYDVTGMSPTAALQLEVLSRPDYTAPGNPTRWLWYWSEMAKVTSVPGNARFDGVPLFNPSSVIQIQQSTLVVGPTATMTNAIGPFMNTHAHLMSYELRNSPVAQPGIYAFFARLKSPGLESSEPFLLAFRNQISVDLFEEAVNDINRATVPSGDFNLDGTVDAADYVVWRKPLPTDGDYSTWRTNFGLTQNGGGGALMNSQVPEPAALILIAYGTAFVLLARRKRSLRTSTAAVDHGLAS